MRGLDLSHSVLLSRRLCGLTLVFGALLGQTAAAQTAPTGQFVDHVYHDSTGDHKYVVFVPANYTPGRPSPIIFYLHGASGRGRDGRAQLIVGLGPGLKQRAATTPFLAVFAQNENMRGRLLGGWHDETTELDRALKVLEEVERTYTVNKDHRVLVGTSMGAFGVWSLAAKDPTKWKAVIPISGGGKPEFIPNLAKVPVWAFHAADDTLVPPSASTDLIDGINAAGGRGYVSIVPTGGHNIGNHVLAQDEVFEWMLHPEKPAVTDIDWPKRPSAPSLIDLLKFVPGAEVERAVTIRLSNDLLESLSYALPGQVPTTALNGFRAGSAERRGEGLMSFNVATGSVQYTGSMERAWVTSQSGNRLRIQLGLRNLVTTVSATSIDSPLLRAQAGPMQIVLGEREPIWLTADIVPRLENRRIRLDVVSVDFQVPQDNWGIRGPSNVRVRPLPFLEDRITQRLVTGLAERKAQIEQEIRNSIPRMIAQMEDRLASITDQTVSYARFPMPLWQPRFRFYPEAITVDENGLVLQLGAQVAA
ncbi:MAG TPA: alpha/beta hydrolase-fold protein, partial [Planctomycetaceae bacterium]|nr:alpha/beta hydrolase-fold protein [Planctomycetaceae bacterium]